MFYRTFGSLLLLSFSLFAQNSPTGANPDLIQVATNPQVSHEEKEYLIEGFILVSGGTLIENIPREHGVTILLEPGDYAPLIASLRDLLNHPLSEVLINQVKTVVVDYFRKERNQFVVAVVPVQEIVNQTIIFQVFEGKVGHIQYKGQKWFSERVIRNRLGIQPGDPLHEDVFLNDVTWLNRNPFIHSQMVLVPAEEKGQTNLTFITIDRFPVRFYTGVDNQGYLTNGTNQVYAGFNWGDAFRMGDLLSYQYTASVNLHNLQVHTVSYSSFLPWKNVLTLFGCYGQVYPIIPDFNVNGIATQGSLRYEVPFLPLYGSFRSSSTFGFDYKFFTSNLFFVGNPLEATPASNQIMAITQLFANYQCQKNWPQDFLSVKCDMFGSPWKDFVPHQSQADYDALRLGSSVRYAYWKIGVNGLHKTLSKWTFSVLARGQLSTAALPTSEQFGLGGADTVRGYFEQQFVADDAFCLNLEVYAPSFPAFNIPKSEMAFLAFLDYGFGYNYVALTPAFIQQNLLGMGPGVRFDIASYLNVKMDYGFQVLGVTDDRQLGRFHFSVNAGY